MWLGICVEVAVDKIWRISIYHGRAVRATPNHKMEAASSVQQKDNMTDTTPRKLGVSHSSSMGPISARGDGSFQVRFGSRFGTNTKLLREVITPISTPNDYLNTVFEIGT